MKSYRLRTIVFLALCCDLGLFCKRLIAPAANIITDFLHIPGGIGTSFSLMFLVIAASLVPKFGCASLMGAVQSLIALSLGMVGSMGALSPLGYIIPGLVIDILILLTGNGEMTRVSRTVLINAIAGCCSALTANLIVFHLWGIPLLLYLSVAATSGSICGILGAEIIRRVAPIIGFSEKISSRNREGGLKNEKK